VWWFTAAAAAEEWMLLGFRRWRERER
jgi:hypothetical protein